jgi:hypothetical protein
MPSKYPEIPANNRLSINFLYLAIKNPINSPLTRHIPNTTQTRAELPPLGKINWKSKINTTIVTEAHEIMKIVTIIIFAPASISNNPSIINSPPKNTLLSNKNNQTGLRSNGHPALA